MTNNHSADMLIKPSQWVNFGWFIFGIGGFMFILPPLIAFLRYLEFYFWQYEFYFRSGVPHIIERKGIFSVERKEVTIRRIKGIRMESPFLMRLVSISNVYIRSSDPYQPELVLYAVPDGLPIWQRLREMSDAERRRNGTREWDMYSL